MSKKEALTELWNEAKNCQRCPLCKTRTNVVFGSGRPNARVMLVGEAPGETEDRFGKPFVGKAGRFLDALLSKVGIERESVWITNSLYCRPPDNRRPERAELIACSPFLRRQVEIINPVVIATLGNSASELFIPNFKGITKSRGRTYQWERWLVVPVFHPASGLYRQENRPLLLEDFRYLKSVIDQEPEKWSLLTE